MIEDILPLSPLQQGFLFHGLYGERDPGSDGTQLVLDLKGLFHEANLRSAAQALLKRHANLRACFRYEELDHPLQIVIQDPPLDWRMVDLSLAEEKERDRRIAQVLEDDWKEAIDLRVAPLFRFTLIRVAPEHHRFIVNHHLIVMDGWSVPIFLRELFTLYRSGGEHSSLPPVTPYREYLAWLSRLDRSASLTVWRDELEGLEHPTMLARLKERFVRTASKHVHISMPEEDSQALEHRARRRGLTLNTLLQGAWGLLLSRLTGHDDVVFGVTVSGRPPEIPGIENMVGLFINTLPLRLRLCAQDDWMDVLTRLQDNQAKLLAHQHVGLAEIQRQAGIGQLFDTLVLFESFPMDQGRSSSGSGLRVSNVGAREANHYPLTLVVVPGERMYFQLSYHPDSFAEETAREILDRLLRLMKVTATDLNCRIAQLDILGPEERRQVLEGWNQTAMPVSDETLPVLFERQARRTPDEVAIVCSSRELTYSELNRRANRLARQLIAEGIGSEDVVGIALPRSVEMVVAVLGVLKAGAAYLPLSSDYPVERLRFMIRDAACLFAIAGAAESAVLSGACRTILLDDKDLVAGLESQSADDLTNDERKRCLNSSHCAYLIYTSGSTGLPKGVQVDHRSLVNLLTAMLSRPGLRQRDSLLAVTTMIFDIAGLELFLPLIVGARCVLAGEEALRDGYRLSKMMEDHGITVMQATPSTWRLLLESGWAGKKDLNIFCGGELLSEHLATQLVPRCNALWNMYGPTETTIWSAVHPISSEEGPISIGHGIGNTQTYVLDGSLLASPIGVAGELYIAGTGLARGYWRRAGLTAERFVANPYGPPGTRMYRTGDVARWRSDGNLEYLGRTDHQVKVRGFRIELEEIEGALLRETAITRAVVVARDGSHGEKRLVAYIVFAAGQSVETVMLRESLRQSLPEYMVPAAIVVLESLPLTPNGKLDRKSLPEPEYVAALGYRAPRTSDEAILCALFAEVLRVPQVGIDDGFFELGGDSITSIQLVGRSRKKGLIITVRDVFERQTVEALAVAARQAADLGNAASGASDEAKNKPLLSLSQAEQEMLKSRHPELEEVLPLAPLQEGLLFHALYDKEAPDTYHWRMVLDLVGDVDEMRLQQAVRLVLHRHGNLRTVFEQEGLSRPVQVIVREAGLPWESFDISAFEEEERAHRLTQVLDADRTRRFDLIVPPLWRFTLIRLAATQYKFVISTHHLVMDGWSAPLFLRELVTIYGQEGDAAGLKQIIPYRKYLEWIAAQNEEAATQAWSDELQGVGEATQVSPGDSRLSREIAHRVTVELPETFTEELVRRSRTLGVTLNTFIQIAWAIIVSRMTGRQDVVFGIAVALRPPEIEGIEAMIGLFINTVPLRMQLSRTERLVDLFSRVQTRQSSLVAHHHLRLTEIKRLTGLEELFDTFVVFQNYPLERGWLEQHSDGFRVVRVDARDTTHYPLTLMAVPGRRLYFHLDYRHERFEQSMVEAVAGWLTRLLGVIASDPRRQVGSLSLLSEREERQILVDWNATQADYPRQRCVHELFEQQVKERPKAVAVEFTGGSLTYEELDTQANRLAHYLHEKGVGIEDIVGLALPRSAEMVVGLLAILKAGAAYLPLDIHYPLERLQFMVNDAKPALLLAHQGILPNDLLSNLEEDLPVVLMDREASEIGACPSTPALLRINSEQLAYMIYTSGTTGRSKGVMIRHTGIVNNLLDLNSSCLVNRQDRVMSLSSFSFDMSVYETLGILAAGGAVVVPEDDQLRDPGQWIELIRKHRVTVWNSAPSMLEMLVHHAQSVPGLGRLELRTAILGGDRVPRTLPAQLGQVAPGTKLVVLGGATEASIHSTVYFFESLDWSGGVIPYGRPMKNQRVYVLDSDLNPVPVGLSGELYLAGDGLARGYHARPALTAERFVANPFGPLGARMYRTGDLVKWHPDGNLDIIGRTDHQVKIRGFRIELGEIESKLVQHPLVREAVVIAREDQPGEKRLVAYVTIADGETLDERDALQGLRQSLPGYMVPSALMVLDALPLTPNGKLDRNALPRPELGQGKSYREPENSTQEILCSYFGEVLRLDRVGIDESFFELGGDSLMAMRLISRIRVAMEIDLPIRALFEAPSVEALADIVKAKLVEAIEQMSEEEIARLALEDSSLLEPNL